MKESQIQWKIFEYLANLDFLVLRINSGSKGHVRFAYWQALGLPIQSEGISDLVALSPGGQWYVIEVKRPGEQPTQTQIQFQREASRRGAIALVITSLEELQAYFERSIHV